MMETISLDLTNGRFLGSVSDPFRTHPKTALGRGTRRWAAFTVLPGTAMDRVNRLAAHVTPGLAPQPVSSGILEVPG